MQAIGSQDLKKKVVLNLSMQSGHRKDIAIEAGISEHEWFKESHGIVSKRQMKFKFKDVVEKGLEISNEPPLFWCLK